MQRTNRYPKGEAKRREILEVSLALIAERGFRRSTLREIAQAVGLTNAGVLHYFASKEELYADVLRLRDMSSRRADPAAVELDDFVATIAANATVPGLVQLYVSLAAEATDPEHGAHTFFADRFERVREALVGLIEREIERGTMAADIDAERLARILIAVADGLQTQWLIRPDVDMADHLAYLISLLGERRAAGCHAERRTVCPVLDAAQGLTEKTVLDVQPVANDHPGVNE